MSYRPLQHFLIAAALLAICCQSQPNFLEQQPPKSPIDYVDPFIGTGGVGYGMANLFPGVQVPFGMVRLSPDTVSLNNSIIKFDYAGGYYYYDHHVRLFSHTHMVGAGVQSLGNIGFMPVSEVPTSKLIVDYNFKSEISHDDEKASPGYYQVHLKSHNINAELSATAHVGVHRYIYKKEAKEKYVLIDVTAGITKNDSVCTNASVSINQNQSQVTGWVHVVNGFTGRVGGVDIYFVAQFDTPFEKYGTWNDGGVSESQSETAGTLIGGFVGGFSNEEVEIYVGISYISLEQAYTNLNYEITTPNLNFDAIHSQAQDIWAKQLQSIVAYGGTNEEQIKFYTALYHSSLAPTSYTEVGGNYVGFDHKPHEVEVNPVTGQNYTYYSDMSIWDVFRTEFPLLGFLKPSMMQDIVWSLQKMKDQGGSIPRWPFVDGYTNCMIGQHADIVVADAFVKGMITADQAGQIYEAIHTAALEDQQNGGRDVKDWWGYGYYPVDQHSDGCSWTLDSSYDDFAIASMAKLLNKTDDFEKFSNSSKNYKNVWHPEKKFFCPKTSDGKWDCPETWVNVFDSRYKEGDAWHYRWFVPHDPEGLIDLFGSVDYFVKELDVFFSRSALDTSNFLPNPYYWAGNEPDLFAVWLFNFANRTDLTSKYTREIIKRSYTTGPGGLAGNDDYGTLSAWYLFTTMGFYPQSGTPTYLIGSPIFDQITIYRDAQPGEDKGGYVNIVVHDNSEENIYVQKITINGNEQEDLRMIQHEQLSGDCKIEIWMGKEKLSAENEIEERIFLEE